MNRRKALFLTSTLVGSTIIGSELFLSGCRPEKEKVALFSDSDVLVLDEVGETILPETKLSPGAKAANIGAFMVTIISDCYDAKEQDIFIKGIADLNGRSKTLYTSDFLKLDPRQKHDLLVLLDQEAREISNEEQVHYFTMMKQLSIWGYFTSEPGATMALRYLPIPGDFKGCIPYEVGDKAWA